MLVYVNDKPHDTPLAPTLADLLTELQLAARRGIAVAINDFVVPRDEWPARPLQAQDRITVIHATQGG